MTETPLMRDGQPNPTGTGRYCAPRRCYCGGCPGYAEQRRAADAQYGIEVVKALGSIGDTAQALSWLNRDEPTWLDA